MRGQGPRQSRYAQCLLAALVLTSTAATAQERFVPFVVQAPASVRYAGLNGAGAALVGHSGAVFTNPAGLATIRHIAVEGGLLTATGEEVMTSGSVAWRLRQFDLGFGIQSLDTDVVGGDGIPIVDPDQSVLVGSLVYRFGLIAMGVSGKRVRREVPDGPAHIGYSGDIGAAIAIFDIMALGFAVQNVGGNWEIDSPIDLPRFTRFGFTMNYVDPQGSFRLLSTIEWQWPEDQDTRFIAGGEAGIVVAGAGVVGRLAYGTRPEESPDPHWTYGATLELRWVDVDVAYEPAAPGLEDIKRIGLRLAF